MKKLYVDGTVANGFESVRKHFEKQMHEMAEREAQLCVYFRGQKVVDLWAAAETQKNLADGFSADSMINIFSSGKNLEAIAVASLFDKGLLNYSDTVAQHWPEFAVESKESLTVADLMRHEAGLANFDSSLNVADLYTSSIKQNAVGRVIERQAPHRKSDRTIVREYHAITRGWIVNELFRRVDPTGRTIGEFLRDDLCGPLGVDVVVGVNDDEWPLVTPVRPLSFAFQFFQSLLPRTMGRRIEHNFLHILGLFMRVLPLFIKSKGLGAAVPVTGMKDLEIFNEREFARGETSSANTHASARGLAKIAAMMAAGGQFDGKQLLSEQAWQALHANPLHAPMGGILTTRFTQGGVDKFEPTPNGSRYEKGLNEGREGFYGWMGLGGSIFQWSPDKDIGFAFVPTALHSLDILNERGKHLQAEVMKCARKLDAV